MGVGAATQLAEVVLNGVGGGEEGGGTWRAGRGKPVVFGVP